MRCCDACVLRFVISCLRWRRSAWLLSISCQTKDTVKQTYRQTALHTHQPTQQPHHHHQHQRLRNSLPPTLVCKRTSEDTWYKTDVLPTNSVQQCIKILKGTQSSNHWSFWHVCYVRLLDSKLRLLQLSTASLLPLLPTRRFASVVYNQRKSTADLICHSTPDDSSVRVNR